MIISKRANSLCHRNYHLQWNKNSRNSLKPWQNEKYNISENFRGEEQNFPGWGTGMKPEPPKAARATFLARILGNFVPHRENFRKYYSHDSNSHSLQLDNCHLKAITVHFTYQNCLKIVVSHLIFSWNTHISEKWECKMRAWSIDQWS